MLKQDKHKQHHETYGIHTNRNTRIKNLSRIFMFIDMRVTCFSNIPEMV